MIVRPHPDRERLKYANAATPIYYGRFRDAVINGEIPVCQEVSMQMNRIDRRIEDPRYYYDDRAVIRFRRFGCWSRPKVYLKLTFALPWAPLLVLTMMIPLAARAP